MKYLLDQWMFSLRNARKLNINLLKLEGFSVVFGVIITFLNKQHVISFSKVMLQSFLSNYNHSSIYVEQQ